MGNYQKLAEQVLTRSILNLNTKCQAQEKVSSFLPLVQETGNFWPKRENQLVNTNETDRHIHQSDIGVQMETNEETIRKLLENKQETFTSGNTHESFQNCFRGVLVGNNVSSILDNFFNGANQLNIQLLPDDKRWLKNICFGVNLHSLKIILEKYIIHWIESMAKEQTKYRKQNAGRFAANTFIREELIKSFVNI
jgi:hypothetical protein